MKTVFADTVYWIAIISPKDHWRKAALNAKDRVGQVWIVTTDEVLSELLTAFRAKGKALREQAAMTVRKILSNPNVKVVPQSRNSFLEGLSLYEKRQDKGYSLTDCISMNVMRTRSITQVLTNDHHFEQEGFGVLMSRDQT